MSRRKSTSNYTTIDCNNKYNDDGGDNDFLFTLQTILTVRPAEDQTNTSQDKGTIANSDHVSDLDRGVKSQANDQGEQWCTPTSAIQVRNFYRSVY